MCLNKIKSNLWQHLEINWFSFFPLPIVISTNDWRPGHLSGQIYGENEIPIVFLLLFSSHIEATFELWWHDSQPERCCHFKLILRECYRPHGVVKFQVIVNITKPMDYSVGSQSILPPGGGKEMSWRSSSRALLCQANRAVNEGRKKKQKRLSVCQYLISCFVVADPANLGTIRLFPLLMKTICGGGFLLSEK